jgi:hypothetical protein
MEMRTNSAFSERADTSTRPPGALNLTALERRLKSACLSRMASAMIGGGGFDLRWLMIVKSLFSASDAISPTHSSTALAAFIADSSNAIRPVSIRLKSRISLISNNRCWPLFNIWLICHCWVLETGSFLFCSNSWA